MSRRELRLAFCEGKETLPTWSRALRRAKQMTMNRRGQGIFFEPYHCQFCHGIHIGSTDQVSKIKKGSPDYGDIPGYPGHEDEVVY